MELLFCGFPGRLSQLPHTPTPGAGSRRQSFHPCLLDPSWKLSGARTASSSDSNFLSTPGPAARESPSPSLSQKHQDRAVLAGPQPQRQPEGISLSKRSSPCSFWYLPATREAPHLKAHCLIHGTAEAGGTFGDPLVPPASPKQAQLQPAQGCLARF